LGEFLATLKRSRTAYQISVVPGSGVRQVNILDPDTIVTETDVHVGSA